jgi:uncharacterized membrane protein YhhN
VEVIFSSGCLLFAIANCAAGYFLLKERRVGVWMGIVTACLEAVALVFFFIDGIRLVLLGIGINLVTFALLTMNWVDLRDDEQVGA